MYIYEENHSWFGAQGSKQNVRKIQKGFEGKRAEEKRKNTEAEPRNKVELPSLLVMFMGKLYRAERERERG